MASWERSAKLYNIHGNECGHAVLIAKVSQDIMS